MMNQALNLTQMRHENEAFRAGKDDEEAKKNRGFVQVYSAGWKRLQNLMKTNPNAARLYALLAEHIDGSGVVVAAQGCWPKCWKSREDHPAPHPRVGDSRGHRPHPGWWRGLCLRPTPRGGLEGMGLVQEYAAFYSKTLVSKKGAGGDIIARKLQVMIREMKGEPELPGLTD